MTLSWLKRLELQLPLFRPQPIPFFSFFWNFSCRPAVFSPSRQNNNSVKKFVRRYILHARSTSLTGWEKENSKEKKKQNEAWTIFRYWAKFLLGLRTVYVWLVLDTPCAQQYIFEIIWIVIKKKKFKPKYIVSYVLCCRLGIHPKTTCRKKFV